MSAEEGFCRDKAETCVLRASCSQIQHVEKKCGEPVGIIEASLYGLKTLYEDIFGKEQSALMQERILRGDYHRRRARLLSGILVLNCGQNGCIIGEILSSPANEKLSQMVFQNIAQNGKIDY